MARYSNKQSNNGSYTLVQLLNERQPYNAIRRLPNSDVTIPDSPVLQRIQGSLLGLAIGDALGAPVEFRPNAYLKEHRVTDMQSGGTWGLQEGQWTDDTSMALCLAASLIVKGRFDAYDQLNRYRRWFREGYMSSTNNCFDIGKSTRQAITDFENFQQKVHRQLIEEKNDPKNDYFDAMIERRLSDQTNGFQFGATNSAGNGALMRLAPIPCFFHLYEDVEKYVDEATKLTHGDQRAIDACRFYAGLIWHAVNGRSKNELLDEKFYRDTLKLSLHKDILEIAQGSYKKKNGYDGGIRGKGHVVSALEAALWAFYNDNDDFETGVLQAVNLGDDTDTTAAIYGQLAGAVYSIHGTGSIPQRWINKLYQADFIKIVAKGLYMNGGRSENKQQQSDWSDANDPQSHQTGSNDKDHDRQNSGKARTTYYHQDSGAAGESEPSRYDNKAGPSQQNQQGSVNNPSESSKRHLITEDK